MTTASLIGTWIGRYPPDRSFLTGPGGVINYGDVGRALGDAPPPGTLLVQPGPSLRSVVELMTLAGGGRRMVVVAPDLPAAERHRRANVAGTVDDGAMTVLFTSGTTGPAKAVRLTEANWEAAVAASASHLHHTSDDVWLAAMPLHHVGGLSILYRTAYVGASVRWVPRFDPAAVVEALRSDVTIVSLVPTMLRRVLDHDRAPFTGLRAALIGGGPIPAGLLEEAHDRGIPALPTYGMTETCAQVATLRPGSGVRYAAHPLPGIEVRLGDGGRISLRGDQVSPGYVGEHDRRRSGWFSTPDRGALDPDGALRILGRVDDVVVTGGENVDPGQVEAVLAGHPEVEAVAVFGVPDPDWGEMVVAAFTGTADPASLQRWAATRLARHEVPRRLRRVDYIPVTGGGKADREELRRRFA